MLSSNRTSHAVVGSALAAGTLLLSISLDSGGVTSIKFWVLIGLGTTLYIIAIDQILNHVHKEDGNDYNEN